MRTQGEGPDPGDRHERAAGSAPGRGGPDGPAADGARPVGTGARTVGCGARPASSLCYDK